MALYLVDPPTAPVMTLAQAKAHLRISHSDDDALITGIVNAATKHAENQMQRVLMPQTWELRLDSFPNQPCSGWQRDYWKYGNPRSSYGDYRTYGNYRAFDSLELPLAPLIEVNSVNYRDTDGA